MAKQYVAIHVNFDGESRLLRLTNSLQEAQTEPNVTHIVAFENGVPVEEYHYIPPQKERIGSYWDEFMMSPLPIYSNNVIPGRWEGPHAYGCNSW